MSRIPLLVLMTILSIPCLLDAEPNRIVVGGGQFQPMLFVAENGQVVGRDVDLWKLWSQKTGVAVEFRLMDWSEAIPALLRHEVDVVDGASFTAERARRLAFTEPYQELSAYAFFRDLSKPIGSLQDLKGLSVGVVAGTNVEEHLRQNVPEANLVPFHDHKTLVAGALAGRVNVFLAEGPMASYYFNQSGGSGGFRRSGKPFLEAELRMAVPLDNTALFNLLNKGFAQISQEERRRLDETWFGGDWLAPRSRSYSLFLLMFLGIVAILVGWGALARTWYRERADIHAVRDAFVNLWLVSFLLFAPFLLGASILSAMRAGWTTALVVQAGAATLLGFTAIFRNKLSYRLKTSVFLGILAITGMAGLLLFGLIGPTVIALLVLVVTAVTLFGTYGGIVSIFVSLVLIGAVGAAVQTGLWNYSYDVNAYAQS